MSYIGQCLIVIAPLAGLLVLQTWIYRRRETQKRVLRDDVRRGLVSAESGKVFTGYGQLVKAIGGTLWTRRTEQRMHEAGLDFDEIVAARDIVLGKAEVCE